MPQNSTAKTATISTLSATSSTDLVNRFATEIETSKVNAFLTVTRDLALEQAAASDAKIQSGAARPLEGVPIAVKDNFCTQGVLTTAGSKILGNFKPEYESTVTGALWNAGAVLMGKANMDEFGMGSSTENSAFGPTLNPAGLALGMDDVVPGGSSGGSAAAVAAGQAVAALGTDTGGSIRQPASFCGVYGMKPTYGLCSRWGIIAYASSLDQAGVIANSPRDIATVLDQIAFEDPKDSTSIARPFASFGENLDAGMAGKTIGIPIEFFEKENTETTEIVWQKLNDAATALGIKVKQVSLKHITKALHAYYVIALSEASSNLARYDGVKYGLRAENTTGIDDLYEQTRAMGFGAEVKKRIMLGTYCLSAGHYDQYYQRACKVRRLIAQDFAAAFGEVDVLAWPTTPTSAFSLNAHSSDPTEMYLQDVFTVPVNLAGLPAINVPIATCSRGLPLGVTFAGAQFADRDVLSFANKFSEISA